jgi:hypothetical protein
MNAGTLGQPARDVVGGGHDWNFLTQVAARLFVERLFECRMQNAEC